MGDSFVPSRRSVSQFMVTLVRNINGQKEEFEGIFWLPCVMSVVLRVKNELGEDLTQSDGIPNVEASWQIDARDLEFGESLGKGNYREVFAGTYFGTDVAIKRINVQVMGEDNLAKYIKRELACSK